MIDEVKTSEVQNYDQFKIKRTALRFVLLIGVVLGILYDLWIPAVVILSVVLQFIAIPIFVNLRRE